MSWLGDTSRFAAVLVLLSCSSAHETVATGPVVANTARFTRTCDVRGEGLWLPAAQVRDTEPFEIDLEGVTAQARVPSTEQPLSIRVSAPVDFTAHRANVWLTVERDLVFDDGMLTLSRGAHIVPGRSEAGSFSGDVVLAEAAPHERPLATVKATRVPCDAVSLTKVVSARLDPIGRAAPPPPPEAVWIPRVAGAALELFSAPGAGTKRTLSHEVLPDGDVRQLTFRVLEERKPWSRVEARGPSVRVSGWVEQSTIVLRSPDWVEIGWGHSGGGRMSMSMKSKREIAYEGPATLLAGSEIRMTPNGKMWARVPRDVEVKVVLPQASKWVEVTRIPGLGSLRFYGLVATEQVVLPTSTK